jgi:hypothetical protein
MVSSLLKAISGSEAVAGGISGIHEICGKNKIF